MKTFLLMLLISSYSFAEDGIATLKGAPAYTCFRYEFLVKPEHKWEKETLKVSLPWVLLDQDETAVYIAQPSSFCDENSVPLRECNYYWFRTVEFKHDWTGHRVNPVKFVCPKGFIEKIKNLEKGSK